MPLEHPKVLADAILQQNSIAFVLANKNGQVVFANEAASHLAWKAPEHTTIDAQTAPQVWGNAYDFEGRAIPVERWPIALALRGIRTVGKDLRLIHPDGSYYDISVSATPLRTGEGIIGAIASFIDITERRLAEQKLTATNKRLEELATERAGGIHLMHLIALSTSNIADVRELFQVALTEICSHMRWSVGFAYVMEGPDRLHGVSRWYSSSPETYEALRRATGTIEFSSKESVIGQALKKGTTVFIPDIEKDEHFLRKDAARQAGLKSSIVIPVMVHKQPAAILEFFHVESIQPQDSVVQVMDVVAAHLGQVIELKRTEKKLQALLDSAPDAQIGTDPLGKMVHLADMGTTTAIFAHELANPLNVISTTIQIIKSNAPAEYQSLLDNLSSEISRLESLLNQFRSLGRLSDLKREPVDFAKLVSHVLEMNSLYWLERGVRTLTDFSGDLNLSADPEKLLQVILNLTKNAVESMPEGGTLTLRAYSTGEEVVIEVGDTGSGIVEGIDVFQPFTTTKQQGTGLGLYIVQQIVLAHRGAITYSTNQEGGTTFRIALPKIRNPNA